MRFAYSFLFYLLLPFAFFRLWRRGAALPEYRQRWAERLGKVHIEPSDKPTIWFHTVSVGEFLATRPLIEHYLNSYNYRIYITTTTPTGSQRVVDAFGDRVEHSYLPYDVPSFMASFVKAIKPSILVIMETEVWPNLYYQCHKRTIPVLLCNARLSEKSANGYKSLGEFTRNTLNHLHHALVQNDEDAERFKLIGLDENKISVTGNIKFDLTIDTERKIQAKELKAQLSNNGQHPIFIAASTHHGEDEQILSAFKTLKKQHPALTLVIVPRHPERFDSVAELIEQAGWTCLRRSRDEMQACDVMLGDTMGELLVLLGAADIAFVGGSLIDNGGHNYIEPAAWSLPVLSGPSYFNFAEVVSLLYKKDAISILPNADALAKKVSILLNDSELAKEMGERGKHVAEQNRGATARLIQAIDATLQGEVL